MSDDMEQAGSKARKDHILYGDAVAGTDVQNIGITPDQSMWRVIIGIVMIFQAVLMCLSYSGFITNSSIFGGSINADSMTEAETWSYVYWAGCGISGVALVVLTVEYSKVKPESTSRLPRYMTITSGYLLASLLTNAGLAGLMSASFKAVKVGSNARPDLFEHTEIASMAINIGLIFFAFLTLEVISRKSVIAEKDDDASDTNGAKNTSDASAGDDDSETRGDKASTHMSRGGIRFRS